MSGRPNILLIIMDHLSPRVVGACGSPRSCTPNIDALADDGCVNFSNMYTNCPLCQPSRTSFWTGLLPHQNGVLSNGGADTPYKETDIDPALPTVGKYMSAAGYRCHHFGKRHDAGSLAGFEIATQEQKHVDQQHPAWPYNSDTYRDRDTTDKCLDFLKAADCSDDQPYMMVADLNNPHNICGWIGENIGEHTDVPIGDDLPPLPDNFDHSDWNNIPKPIQHICCSHRRMSQAAKWNKENYRHYIAAFEHYTRVGDAMVGEILSAARKRSDWDNTLVIITADHGDGQASHRMVTKQVSMYDETTKVPFVVAGKALGSTQHTQRDQLCSLLDLMPTLREIAASDDVPQPQSCFDGASIAGLITGDGEFAGHEYVVSQWHTEWGFTISPGRMIRSGQYKYTRYIEGDGEELYDMQNDSGETVNLATDEKYKDVLDQHRKYLDSYIAETNDPFFQLEVFADPQWRSHEAGYWNHSGLSAPDAMFK